MESLGWVVAVWRLDLGQPGQKHVEAARGRTVRLHVTRSFTPCVKRKYSYIAWCVVHGARGVCKRRVRQKKSLLCGVRRVTRGVRRVLGPLSPLMSLAELTIRLHKTFF